MTTNTKEKKVEQKKVEQKTRKFKEVESNFLNLTEEGESIEGTVISRDIVAFQGGGSAGRYKLESIDGKVTTVLGSTVLDDQMNMIPNGTYVRITLLGYEGKKGSPNKTKQYKLEVAE